MQSIVNVSDHQTHVKTFRGQLRRHFSPAKTSAVPRDTDVTFDGFNAQKKTGKDGMIKQN
jgi:hypothetical protein